MTNWEKLVTDEALEECAKARKTSTIEKKVDANNVASEQAQGWVIKKTYAKGGTLMEKAKPIGAAFEDEVWMIFKKMGFKILNSDNSFALEYSPGLTKQIDVVAIDDDVCLLIECKATASDGKISNWKMDLEAIDGFKSKLFKEIQKKYPHRKCRYIFATKNYLIGEQDEKRMKDFQIANFDYETVRYYNELVNHLGSAAKYQLLGSLFAKQTIPQFDDEVPAIEGKMGGLTYYSFAIEPERLLKLAYVLHKNKGNKVDADSMSTYQRLIKKDRLAAIRKFVTDGGYFPNSLIVSVDTDSKGVVFEQLKPKKQGSSLRIGTLHLPKKYQSVYVIDGQHRLYGYSETKWAGKNSIPVVAFIDLPKDEQVKMFMDINQNQKAVSKSLRNTLNIDLLWNAENYTSRTEALMLFLAQRMGEDSRSPLFGRVVVGEDTISGKRCITLEYIKEALKQTKFFNTYKGKTNEIKTIGTFDKSNNDATKDFLYPFLIKCLKTIRDNCSVEWEKGEGGFLTINNCMFAVIRIIDDIANIVLEKEGKTTVDDSTSFYKDCEPLLLSLCDTINNLSDDSISVIKKSKGGSAKRDSWRKLQVAFHERDESFINDDLDAYIRENCVNNDDECRTYLGRILDSFKKRLFASLPEKDDWVNKYLPEGTKNDLIGRTAIENNNRRSKGNQIVATEWDYVDFAVIAEMLKFGDNWSRFGSKVFNDGTQIINKPNALTLLRNFDSYQKKLSGSNHVVSSQFKEVKETYESMVSAVETLPSEDEQDGTNS